MDNKKSERASQDITSYDVIRLSKKATSFIFLKSVGKTPNVDMQVASKYYSCLSASSNACQIGQSLDIAQLKNLKETSLSSLRDIPRLFCVQ